MKRIVTIVSALSLLLTAQAMAEPYGWTLSLSNSDPMANTGATFPGFGTVYLWLNCTTPLDPGGAAAFGAEVGFTGFSTIAGFTPSAGVLNAGSATHPLLAIGGCPVGPVVVGSFTVIGVSGTMCLGTVADPDVITVDCDLITPTEFPSAVIGMDNAGGVPCSTGTQCPLISVEANTWGSVKSLYR